jgi:hypothetical protein
MEAHPIQTTSGGTNEVYHGREKKITAQFASRYWKAGKHEKSKILDEYPVLSGAESQKYAIFKLNRIEKTQLRMMDGQAVNVEKSQKTGLPTLPYYDAEVAATLESLWKNFNRPCGKLFAPFLRQNFDLIILREEYPMSDSVTFLSNRHDSA